MGDAEGEGVEEYYNTKLNLFEKKKPHFFVKAVFNSVTYKYCTHFTPVRRSDKKFFLLRFLTCEKTIQMLMEEIRKTIKAPIKNLNSPVAYMV